MHASGGGSDFSIQVNKSDLGGATSFDLYATSLASDASGNALAHDVAPDVGAWLYDINGPSKTLIAFLRPTFGKPVFVPAKPTAGKRLTVSLPVTVSALGKPAAPLTTGKIVGSASIGGKAVPHATSLKGGVAKVSLLVPASARGKTVNVSVTVTPPSSENDDSTWVDITSGEQGLQANLVKGMSTTKTLSVTVR